MDCADIKTTVGHHTFRGLPDANDFSKHKDFYAIYLWTYCSGHVSQDGTSYNVDFCAKPGTKALFNLYRYWSVWGAQVHKDGTRFFWLEHGPNGLYMLYIASVLFAVVVLLSGRRSLSSNHISGWTIFLSSVSNLNTPIVSSQLKTLGLFSSRLHRLWRLQQPHSSSLAISSAGQTSPT
ncbi:hypothetical protein B0I35DRAFT_428846 [Stachybotrys elegans]|uniref:Uncharacterized protein n=1 Tax=Stachybotrys elegans TaxID=80388 RepID=A0A8K0SV14_9HYPO|nr:hypothetical protein B0I35DRAFT_428846 [Stachybotrys elegans]